IRVTEGYASAFSNSSGQTNPTQVRIRVTDFPDNLQMIFPAVVTAKESAATLNTVGGAVVTLPFSNGKNEVIYAFSKAANSDETLESFDIRFTLNVLGPVPDIQPTIEVSLTPIGDVYSSAGIPRYAEDEITIQEGSSRIISKVLYWTGISGAVQNQVYVTNP